MNNKDPKTSYSCFLKLFRQHENCIFSFILKAIPNFTIAEDIMQETLLTLWERFDEFEEGTNFAAWARQVAHYKVISFLDRNRRRSIIRFDHDTLEVMMHETTSKEFDSTLFEALHSCIDKLQGKSRQLIQFRYLKSMKIKQIADTWNISEKTLYRQMAKIHVHLQKCIESTLAAWEFTNE